MGSIDRWNKRYRSGDLGASRPAPILVEILGQLTPGRALDLACGAGRNAFYLLDHGWSVLAVDASAEALDIVRQARIEVRQIDLEREPIPFADESFDLVCIIHFLHRPLFADARRLLRRGGIVVSVIHTTRSTMNPLYTLAPGELRSYFADWEVIVDRENEIAELAARKP